MSTTVTAVAERLSIFEQSAAYATDVLRSVTPDDLGRSTPCEEWDVRAVALHIADVADAVIDLTKTGELVMPKPRSRTAPDPAATAIERIQALRQVLRTFAEHGPAELFLGAAQGGANELAAHAWDIAYGLGLDRPIPDATATGLLTAIEGHLDSGARGDTFAAAVPSAPDAIPSDRFVAYLGRRPGMSSR